jgi:alkaline phosphatase
MKRYVDGFVITIPKKNVAAYKKMAADGGKLWMKHGALSYMECVGDDLQPSFGLPFPKLTNAKKTETVIFSYIVYKSRKHRDQVNRRVMQDPGMKEPPKKIPFDMKRMAYGGFEAIVAH